MIKVYNAVYRIYDFIKADGYIAIYDDNTIEGIFALDYIHIYEYDKNSICFLKTLSYYTKNKVLIPESKLYEFYSSKQLFSPFETYYFFNNSGSKFSLEINEEVLDSEDIKIVLIDIASKRV